MFGSATHMSPITLGCAGAHFNVFNAHKNINSFMTTAHQLTCSPGLDIAWLR